MELFLYPILKCHVLPLLKIGELGHADAGQMNMYLNYYRENEGEEADNSFVGIISVPAEMRHWLGTLQWDCHNRHLCQNV